MTVNNIFYFIISLLLSTLAGFLLFWLFFIIFCELFPPVTSDGKHLLMPIGQMMAALLISIIPGIVCMVFSFKKLKQKYK